MRERPDLIILDYNMPVMDGVSMLRQLRENADLRAHAGDHADRRNRARKTSPPWPAWVFATTSPSHLARSFFLAKVARAISLVARPTHDRRERKPGPAVGTAGTQKPSDPQTLQILRQNLRSHPPRHRQPRCSGPRCWWWMTVAPCGLASLGR